MRGFALEGDKCDFDDKYFIVISISIRNVKSVCVICFFCLIQPMAWVWVRDYRYSTNDRKETFIIFPVLFGDFIGAEITHFPFNTQKHKIDNNSCATQQPEVVNEFVNHLI